MAKAAFCMAITVSQASQIVTELRRNGFCHDDISILYADKGTRRDFTHANATKAPEGATAGKSARASSATEMSSAPAR